MSPNEPKPGFRAVAYRYETIGGRLNVYRVVFGRERLLYEVVLQSVRYMGVNPPGIHTARKRRLAPLFTRGKRYLLLGAGENAALLIIAAPAGVYEYIRQYMRNLPAKN